MFPSYCIDNNTNLHVDEVSFDNNTNLHVGEVSLSDFDFFFHGGQSQLVTVLEC